MHKPKSCSACGGKVLARGLCRAHYYAAKRAGELESHALERAPAGSGTINADGYRVIPRPGHPKAMSMGRALEHAVVFHDTYGDVPFACHICGDEVMPGDFTIDHVNEVKTDNRIENLAPAHRSCNTRRAWENRRKRQAMPLEGARHG